jgi:hypothetical protein
MTSVRNPFNKDAEQITLLRNPSNKDAEQITSLQDPSDENPDIPESNNRNIVIVSSLTCIADVFSRSYGVASLTALFNR